MIEAYTGYPGNGKTFACTYRAYKDIKRGYKVFTNYPVRGAYKITFEDLINYTFPQYSTVIIDESGRWFNSRKWKELPAEVFDLFTLHRHMKLDLIVAVQNFNRIDVALREVIELVWWSRNSPLLPFFIYEGYFDVEKVGMRGEANKRMYVWKKSRARKLYDTHVMAKEVTKDEIPLVPWLEEDASKYTLGKMVDSVLDGCRTVGRRLGQQGTRIFRLVRPKATTEPGARRDTAE